MTTAAFTTDREPRFAQDESVRPGRLRSFWDSFFAARRHAYAAEACAAADLPHMSDAMLKDIGLVPDAVRHSHLEPRDDIRIWL
ncbi:MAG: hypothetical protein KDJ41_11355 [Hyphomicrobiaceae bacterium]|nr:hypothetical protein [Hyphomicrobiaceae bacterium]